MRIRPLRLRTQLSLAMVIAVALTVLFGYGGLTLISDWQQQHYISHLSAEARRAGERLEAGKLPDQQDLAALSRAARKGNIEADRTQNSALVVLSIIAAGVGVVVGSGIATRLGRPIEAVAAAARQVARGDLSARALPERVASGEIALLVADFNKMAQALQAFDREMRESSAAIAHELRTPLTVLRGRLQGHMDGVFAWDRDAAAHLIDQVEALARIVDDLQLVSLAASGRLELRLASADLADVVGRLVDGLRPQLALAGLTIRADLQPAPLVVDARRLTQATLALIDNARRHAASGGEISVEVFGDPSRAILRVMDRGPGLPEGAGDRVFERFWRAEESRSRQTGGSGLGLSVVKAIVSAHGGEVRAAQRPGGGALFEINLPQKI